MANMVDSLIRTLQRFFEYDLMGHVNWSNVKIFVPKADEERQTVGAMFDLHGREYEVVIEGSEVNPAYNCGSVYLNDRRYGPIDERTWTAIALEIKKQISRAVA